MLSKIYRLPSFAIANVLHSGKRTFCAVATLIYKRTDALVPRFAVIVSKKIDRRATQRNRVKRLVHESLRHIVSKSPRIDGVLLVNKQIPDSQAEVEKSILSLLQTL